MEYSLYVDRDKTGITYINTSHAKKTAVGAAREYFTQCIENEAARVGGEFATSRALTASIQYETCFVVPDGTPKQDIPDAACYELDGYEFGTEFDGEYIVYVSGPVDGFWGTIHLGYLDLKSALTWAKWLSHNPPGRIADSAAIHVRRNTGRVVARYPITCDGPAMRR